MPTATLARMAAPPLRFAVSHCPVYILYHGTLYVRQGGDWDQSSTYRRTHLMEVDDHMLDPDSPLDARLAAD